MSKTFKIQDGDISDGYHTFDELYEHRCLLFINVCMADRSNAFWKEDFAGWDCIYWESPSGQISYHVPTSMRPLYEGKIEHDPQHVWDGHQSTDTIFRLRNNAIQVKP